MKVLIVNLRIGTGSVGRIVSDLYYGCVGAGIECKLAYARGDIGDIPRVDTYRICSENEVRIHAGLTRLFGNTAFYFAKTTEKFCQWIKEYDPDIIHLHGVYGYYLNMQTLFDYLSKSRAVVISTLHSCWDFTGHCCYFDFVGCDQWKIGCKRCSQKKSYPASSFLDNTARNYQRKKSAYDNLRKCIIVTPSKWLADLAKDSFLRDKEIKVINNGVDLESFKPYEEKSKILSGIDKPIILCVASIWDRRKGWNDVVELSHMISDNLQLVVVGVKEKQKKELDKRTISIERTDSKEKLAELYSSSTILFNPTYEDNYPTVNLEATACHTPVVTYQTGGSPEIFGYGNWGAVIEKGNFDELLSYTQRVFDGKVVCDFGETEKLSNLHMVNNYLALYKSLSTC